LGHRVIDYSITRLPDYSITDSASRLSCAEEVRVDELVDERLVAGSLSRTECHADAAIRSRDVALRVDVLLRAGMRKRTLILAPPSSGLVVRIAMPPRLRSA